MYELIERIACGGMAEIYLARELEGDGPAADNLVVKRILPNFAADRDLVVMFLDEQRVASTLIHPNIVRTYDVGDVDGEYFISMEYLDGKDVRSIAQLLRERKERLPLGLALSIVTQAAAGLHYAHEKRGMDLLPLNIVHRDVSPHNLLVTFDGVVKLLDFGVVQAANIQHNTKVGTIKGKVPYMSPEQCKGLDLDRRSDVFALGIVLYELTTGSRLYGVGNNDMAIMSRIVEEPLQPPSQRIAGYPAELERIVRKALEKKPEARYPDAEALKGDLEAFADSNDINLAPADLAHFMGAYFQKNSLSWAAADSEIAQAIERIGPPAGDDGDDDGDDGDRAHRERIDDDDEDIIFRADDRASGSMRSQRGGERKHRGAALSQSMSSVWGAADSSELRLPAIERPARAPTGSDNPPAARAVARASTRETAPAPRLSSTPALLGMPWWWLAVLVVGMGLSFWLGSLL